MDIRPLTDDYAVSPQIAAEDAAAIAAAGYRTVICNRPDVEVTPELGADAIGTAVRAAGMSFVVLPLTHDTLRAQAAAQRRARTEADGPVLAYCASGTRSTLAWALGQAGAMPADDIVAAAARAGYDIAALRPELGG